MCDGATAARTSHRLIGTFAAGKGFEIAAQDRFSRSGNVVSTHDKI
jgi:hypothetical protein